MQIVLTGGNRGIGAELAAQLGARGDQVLATSRDGATGVSLDVTDKAALAALAGAESAPVDLLICNAGVYLDKGHEIGAGFDTQDWANTFAVNVTAVFETVEAFLPRLKASGAPKIAIIASRMGSNTASRSGKSYIYRASKAAAINLASNLAIDLAPYGIAVGAYHPGWVRTDMGGSEADIDVATSAAGLIARFDALGPDHTGVFESYDGTALPF